MTICQELKCKKQESNKHVGTLCEFHAKKLDKYENTSNFGYRKTLTYKTINKKNSVWENGCEHVRSIPTSMVNEWITNTIKKKKTLEDMLKLVQEQMKVTEKKLEAHQKTKNSRYVKNEL